MSRADERFWLKLAREMGIPKERLKDEMSQAEFVEHRIDYELCPWGDDWEQTDMLLRAQVGKPPHGRDWIPRRRIPVTPQTQEQLVAKINMLFGIDPEKYRG